MPSIHGLEKVTPTATQMKAWEETVAGVQWACPAFIHIAYELLDSDGTQHAAIFTKGIDVAATDAKSVFINPDNFLPMKLPRRIFIYAHEIMHVILEHIVIGHHCRKTGKVKFVDGTWLPYDHDIMNQTMDYIINDELIRSNVGEFPSDGPFKGLHARNLVTADDDLFEAYRKVYKQRGGAGGGGKGQPGDGPSQHGGGFCQHMEPGTGTGKDPTNTVAGHNPQKIQGAVEAGMASAKAQGKLPAGLARRFEQLVQGTVNWQEHIRALMWRSVGGGSYDWRKAARRLIVRDIFSPRRSGYGCELVVCAGDSSGSIGQEDIDLFFGEMAAMLEDVKPRRIIFMWCDAQVHSVDEIEDAGELAHLHKQGAKGGGGTDFRPVFEKVEELGLRPDCLVYLTDLYGTFPNTAPNYPVVWGSISKGVGAPFGELVEVPKQAT